MKNSVSIIVLSLMRLEQTRFCIGSLFANTTLDFELIVVDMGSTGDALDYFNGLTDQHENICVVYNKENLGTTAGRNQGLALANTDWVVFLDNDTEVTEGWLEALLACGADPEVGACAPRLLSPNGKILVAPSSLIAEKENGSLSKIGFRFEQSLTADSPLVCQNQTLPWYPTTCLMVRRELLEQINGFDASLFMAEEDKDLCLRIRQQGFDIVYVATADIVHAQLNKNPEYRAIRDDLMVIKKDIDTFEKKWQCKVVLECRRSYLRKLGMPDKVIDLKKRFDVFSTVLEDE